MIRISLLLGWFLMMAVGAGAQTDLYDMKHIVDIRIRFTEPNWHDLLDSLKEKGDDERLVAHVKVDGKNYPNSGIRYKGNSSYFNVRNAGGKKLPFNIKVDFVEKGARLPGGYVTLKLSNVFRDPSFLREVLSYEIAGKYMPAPRANFAKVYVNDDYLGLYNLSESVDDDFLDAYYGEHKGAFFKCDPSWHETNSGKCQVGHNSSLEYLGKDTVCYYPYYEIKSKHGWAALQEFTRVLNQEPQRLDEVLDVNQALWMLAFNNVMVNLDSYAGRLCHNYYFYQDKHKIWHPIIWDLNLSMGGFRYPDAGVPMTNEAMQDMSLFLHFKADNTERPLIVKLLGIDRYRKIYLAHVRTLVEENFANGWYKTRAAEIQKLIAPLVANDPNRLYDLDTYRKNFTETVRIENSSVIGITELMDKRAANILQHPILLKAPPKIASVKHQVAADNAAFTVQATEADAVHVYYQAQPLAPWQRLPLTAATPGEWTGKVALSPGMRYYIVAENRYIAALSPARAGKEYYEIKAK